MLKIITIKGWISLHSVHSHMAKTGGGEKKQSSFYV